MSIGHVHNINYIDFIKQIMPIDKKEIRNVDKIKCFYGIQDNFHYAVIKSEDEQTVHAIIRIQ